MKTKYNKETMEESKSKKSEEKKRDWVDKWLEFFEKSEI